MLLFRFILSAPKAGHAPISAHAPLQVGEFIQQFIHGERLHVYKGRTFENPAEFNQTARDLLATAGAYAPYIIVPHVTGTVAPEPEQPEAPLLQQPSEAFTLWPQPIFPTLSAETPEQDAPPSEGDATGASGVPNPTPVIASGVCAPPPEPPPPAQKSKQKTRSKKKAKPPKPAAPPPHAD